jgi:hypothetical protein
MGQALPVRARPGWRARAGTKMLATILSTCLFTISLAHYAALKSTTSLDVMYAAQMYDNTTKGQSKGTGTGMKRKGHHESHHHCICLPTRATQAQAALQSCSYKHMPPNTSHACIEAGSADTGSAERTRT